MLRKFSKPCAILITSIVILSCGGKAKVTFRPAEAPKYPAKAPNCEIAILDERPSRDYVELGLSTTTTKDIEQAAMS